MSFLYPAFLWGLLAVAIPIAVHLFNFRRTKRVLFTNIAFLKEIETQKSSFRRLKHLLILLSRVMMIACLALAFAQPFLKDKDHVSDLSGITGVYLDNSFSMQNELNNKRFIDIATGALDELMSMYSNLTSLQLTTNDFSSDENTLLIASGFQDKLTSTNLSPTSRTLQEVYDRQKRLMENARGKAGGELYWVSDFQKSTSGDLSKLELDTTVQLNLIPVQTEEIKNVFVDSVWLETPFLRKQQRNVLNVKISNSGNELVENLPVKLMLNDTQVSATSVNLPANGSEDIAFDFSLNEDGYIRGVVGFDDFPVTFDNQFYFVLNASPALNIIHLTSADNMSDPINRVYRNDSLFQVTNLNAGNADLGQLNTADLVVLNGVERPSSSLMAGLTKFVREGGSLLIIPSLSPDENSFKSSLAEMGVFGLASQPSTMVPMSEPDEKIPFFEEVFEASLNSGRQVNMPAAANVWKWSNSGNVLLSLRNGQPFLSQVSSGKGKLYLMGAPLDPARGNFAQHAIFVPVMYRIAALSSRPRRTGYTFDDRTIDLNVSNARPNAVFKLKQGEVELIPIQRLVGNNLTLEIPQRADLSSEALSAGYFELTSDEETLDLLAVNLGKSESELSYYSAKELREYFSGHPNVHIFEEIEDSDIKSKFDSKASGTRLWKYFLYAALAFLLAEIVLVRLLKD